jgi:imidazolonepropionase-like amidohydrolase
MDLTRKIVLGLFLGLAAVAIADDHPAETNSILALTGGTVRTQTEAGDFVGTIIIRGGEVVEVGPKVRPPAGSKIIDVTGCVITPGLIDAHGTLGLHASSIAEAGRDASLDILDAVDPYSDDWRDAARQGITAVYVQPSAAGNLGGSGAVLRVGDYEDGKSLSLRSPAGVQVMLGSAPQAAPQPMQGFNQFAGRRGGFPNLPQAQPAAAPPAATTLTRFAQYEQVRGQFDAAKRYGAEKPTKHDKPKDLLLQAIKGEIPVRIEVHHEDDIRNSSQLVDEFGIQAVFERLDRVRTIPDSLRTSRAAIVLGPMAGTHPSAELKKIALDGRRIVFGTFGDQSRDTIGLRLHAAAAVASGFPRERVLRALTRDAADLLGVGDKLGRIAPGFPADLAVFAGEPLDPSVPVRLTLSQGKMTFDGTREPTQQSSRRIGFDAGRSNTKPTLDRDSAKHLVSARDSSSGNATEAAASQGTALPEKLPARYLIKTRRLLMPNGEFAPGELRVFDGRVVAANNSDDAGMAIFDVGNMAITPGLVGGHFVVGSEMAADADSADLRAVDGLSPDDSRIRGCRDSGFLTVVAAPGSNNVIAGMVEAVRASEPIAAPEVGQKFVLTAGSRNSERFPVSLAGQIEFIDSRLNGTPFETNMFLPAAVRASILAQRDRALAAVRERKVVAYFEADTRTEIRAALRLIDEYKLRGVLVAPRDVERLTDEIRDAGVAVVVRPIKPRDPVRLSDAMVALGAAGVPLAFGGDPTEMRTTAAWLVNAGLAPSAARKALIAQAGEAFGLPAGAGRLAAGDSADFVIWTGDSLDLGNHPSAVVVKGERVAIGSGDVARGPDRGRAQASPARTGRRGR